MYDYAEIAETGSTMSTPTSNQDPPFAAEGLGDTVINLDEVCVRCLKSFAIYKRLHVLLSLPVGVTRDV